LGDEFLTRLSAQMEFWREKQGKTLIFCHCYRPKWNFGGKNKVRL
jgi:hypothetical protein